jgi:hypothetical protein
VSGAVKRFCRGCRKFKSQRSFDPDARTAEGLSRYCRACGSKQRIEAAAAARKPKRCRTCLRWKGRRFFAPDARTADGLNRDCRACKSAARRKGGTRTS